MPGRATTTEEWFDGIWTVIDIDVAAHLAGVWRMITAFVPSASALCRMTSE